MADQNTFDWQGHRGCRGILPENSIPAFLRAMDYPIKTLELDVAVSKDGKIIVSHDPFFSHHICKNPDGTPVTEEEEENLRIFEMTYEEIKAYDCGSRGNDRFPEQKPTVVNKPSLEDMVNAINVYCEHNKREKPFYNIEIKSRPEWYDSIVPQPTLFVSTLLKELKDLEITEMSCVQSFDPAVMIELNKQAPKVVNAFLVENLNGFKKNMALIDFIPDIYSPYYKFIDEALVNEVKAENMKLIPWTVNEIEDMITLRALGVDGIITDYPNRIEEALDRERVKKMQE